MTASSLQGRRPRLPRTLKALPLGPRERQVWAFLRAQVQHTDQGWVAEASYGQIASGCGIRRRARVAHALQGLWLFRVIDWQHAGPRGTNRYRLNLPEYWRPRITGKVARCLPPVAPLDVTKAQRAAYMRHYMRRWRKRSSSRRVTPAVPVRVNSAVPTSELLKR